MRRKDREVTDLNQIFEIVRNCSVAHVGMVENGKPYVVALNFGYERQGDTLVLYFHSAYEGHKMDILKENPDIYFQLDCVNEFIEDPEEKANALNCMIRHLGKIEDTFQFSGGNVEKNLCL